MASLNLFPDLNLPEPTEANEKDAVFMEITSVLN